MKENVVASRTYNGYYFKFIIRGFNLIMCKIVHLKRYHKCIWYNWNLVYPMNEKVIKWPTGGL